MTTPAKFFLDIEKYAAETKGRLDEFVSEVVQDIAEDIIRNSPVDTGFFRASWHANLNELPGIGLVNPAPADRVRAAAGKDPMASIIFAAKDIKAGDVFYMMNAAVYAVHLEFGTSRMAPRAIVRSTLARADAIAAAAAQRVGLR
jgi:hypothetical protein